MHAPTRPAMTAGFLVFGAALPTYAVALRQALPGQAWKFAAANGVATLGVAAFSLGTPTSGDIHGVFAGLAYASLAATPIAASVVTTPAWSLQTCADVDHDRSRCRYRTRGQRCGSNHVHGLFQRIGLTIGDAWLIASAVAMMRTLPSGPPEPAVSGEQVDPAG